jgi:hypothetical protein
MAEVNIAIALFTVAVALALPYFLNKYLADLIEMRKPLKVSEYVYYSGEELPSRYLKN